MIALWILGGGAAFALAALACSAAEAAVEVWLEIMSERFGRLTGPVVVLFLIGAMLGALAYLGRGWGG